MSTAAIHSLPNEVIVRILGSLDRRSRLRASFTCLKWLELLTTVNSIKLNRLLELDFYLDHSCSPDVFYRSDRDTQISICQCDEHYRCHLNLLRLFVARNIGKRLGALRIEDFVASKDSEETKGLNDSTVFTLLGMCGNETKRLCFKDVNLTSVKYWTLLLMAQFDSLDTVEFSSCQYPILFAERFLSAILMNSARTLTSITITETGLIGDKFCTKIARNCLSLEELNVAGCILVTQNTVIAFCESVALGYHQALSITLTITGTAFDGGKLYRSLRSGQMTCGPCWNPDRLKIDVLGYEKDVVLLQNTEANAVIVVYL